MRPCRGMDPSSLETFGLCPNSASPFMSAPKAVGLFVTQAKTTNWDGMNPKVILGSFALDIDGLPHYDLVSCHGPPFPCPG